MLDKYQCITKLAAVRTNQVVVTMMSLADPWAELSDGPLDYASVDSAMGHGADFAYGIAKAQPQRRIIALNGDGSMLMCLGTLVTLAQYPINNFTLVIVENGTYEVTGNQPVPGHGLMSFEMIARGAGLTNVHTLSDTDTFERSLSAHLNGPGLQVFIWKVARTEQPIPKPSLPIKQRTHRLRKALTTQANDPPETP